MNIPKQIDEIVLHRQEKLPQIQQMIERLENVNNVIQKLEKVCQDASFEKPQIYESLFNQCSEIAENLRLINTKSFRQRYEKVQETLNQLYNRFSRKQIHISFVGRAGQGKSLVMQKISGLSGDIIPSSNGSDCTGTKSIITNQDTTGVHAEIIFYSKNEYKDIVNKYIQEIFENGIYEINSVEEISVLKQYSLETKVESNAQKQSLFLQLNKYIEHSDVVLPLLGTTQTIPAEEIESYVAQYSHLDKSHKYYKYLGVKVANIKCQFPFSQCGKIVLVDTIGLGDTALDIREKMLSTVSEDSDAIVMMTRPDPQRPSIVQYDIDIVNDIGAKMSSDYTNKMLFWIINQVSEGEGKNIDGISEFLSRLKRMRDFPVADYLVVDCNDKNAVERDLLIPILEKLPNNLPQMDEMLLKQAEGQLIELYWEYHEISSKVNKAFNASIDQDVKREFDLVIKKTYEKMTNNVREAYVNEPYGKLRAENCKEFEAAAKEKMRNILINIPTKQTILEFLDNGSINQHNAYERLTDKMRILIIDDFLELNKTLEKLVTQMKQCIVNILANENSGRLKYIIVSNPENADMWLKEFIEFTQNYPRYKPITDAIKKLSAFNMSMESFLIYRVRAQLDEIDLSLQAQGPVLQGSLAEKSTLADDIHFWLEHYLEIVYQKIQTELATLYAYPNSTLWAVIKDFYDRIVYSQNKDIDAKTAWRYLYENSIPQIWREDYKNYQAQKGIAEDWNTLIEEIHKYDNKNLYQFN
ncbi:hypothetical protein B5E53_18340 [Eubacterium sp. An11]|uniref:hypothetical protein n=1 Tax=Eubacterium sp. An11 TaxID=1965542 RepID=UPI000B3A4B88|nr:hypothetical protein [Eubacterium sp. An11]OUQ62058.1 hypothetical protein B5E53_18340 [Eubacterium sp. An11]